MNTTCINCKYLCFYANKYYCGHPNFHEGLGKSKRIIDDPYKESCRHFEHSKNRQSSNSTPVFQTVKVQNRPSKFKHLNPNLNFTDIVER